MTDEEEYSYNRMMNRRDREELELLRKERRAAQERQNYPDYIPQGQNAQPREETGSVFHDDIPPASVRSPLGCYDQLFSGGNFSGKSAAEQIGLVGGHLDNLSSGGQLGLYGNRKRSYSVISQVLPQLARKPNVEQPEEGEY